MIEMNPIPTKFKMLFCMFLVLLQSASGFNTSSLDVANFNLDPKELSESRDTLDVTVAIKDPLSSPGNLQNVSMLYASFTGPWHDRNQTIPLKAYGGNRENGIYYGSYKFTKEDMGISGFPNLGLGSNGIWSLDRLLVYYDNGDVQDLTVPKQSDTCFRLPWSWYTICLILVSGAIFLIFAYLILLHEYIKKKQRQKKDQIIEKAEKINEISDKIRNIENSVNGIEVQIKIIADKTSGQGTDDHDRINEAIDKASAAERDALQANHYAIEAKGLAADIKKKVEERESSPKRSFNPFKALNNLISGIWNLLVFPFDHMDDLGNVIKEIYKIDNAPSASRAQFLIWTAVAAYSYIAITADKAIIHGYFNFETDFPVNLILAMGLSAGTAIASQSISKPIAGDITDAKGGILLDDAGNFDLGKIQMIAWTVIAAGAYLIAVYHNIFSGFALPGLPDIDTSLLALMGIGDTTYLLKKKIDDRPKPVPP
ncbi:MAG: hypothetical protein PHQ34_05705 [Methanothrix sp.]|nr:hypothetical protein [Methanothrix sp.]